MSVAGFVLSLVGVFVLPIVAGPLGVIFSCLGLKSKKKKGLALAGLIVGILDTVYAVFQLATLG
jgi:hypothetical protein